ncbi:MAG: hypothetical protein ACFBRM_04980 [Pikeienuella sp.]
MVVPPSSADLRVPASGDSARAERFAATLDPAALMRRLEARRVQADSLPWLTGTAPGLAFLAAPAPRAIARGAPAARCPATGLASAATDAGASRTEITRRAAQRCLAALPQRSDTEECGCEILAIDNVVTASLDRFAYATGVTARIKAPGLGIDAIWVAEEDPGGAVLLRDLQGPVGRLTAPAAGRGRLILERSGITLEGRREPVGFRRGRLAERLYLADADGRRAVLLIGFSPDELAEGAAAAFAWPRGG